MLKCGGRSDRSFGMLVTCFLFDRFNVDREVRNLFFTFTLVLLKVNFRFLDFPNKVQVSILQWFLCYEFHELFQEF